MPYMRKESEVPAKGKGSKLTEKMERFVEEYMIDLNASAAVLRAGYKTRNQHKMGAELLRHPLIRDRVDELKKDRSDRMELTGDYLINKLVSIIENDETRTADQLRAIELAGKSLALWKERQEITGADGGDIAIQQKKVEDDVADFTRRISRLTDRAGKVVPLREESDSKESVS